MSIPVAPFHPDGGARWGDASFGPGFTARHCDKQYPVQTIDTSRLLAEPRTAHVAAVRMHRGGKVFAVRVFHVFCEHPMCRGRSLGAPTHRIRTHVPAWRAHDFFDVSTLQTQP